LDILEQEAGKPFKIKGIAMIKNSLSANGKFYSDKLVEGIVSKISGIIESNGSFPLSMMADHPGIVSNQTLSTVGKITAMYLEGDNAIIESEIANTSVGKDVQELIRGKFVEGLSIRASNGKFIERYIGDRLVNDVIEMDLKGVDLVVNPGVHGAKVLDIIESDNTSNIFISIEENDNPNKDNNKGDPEMKYDLMEATLELLKSKRPDLFESVKEDLKPVFESEFKLGEITESVNTLTTTNGDLQESVNTLTEDKKILEADLDAVKNSLLESENKLKAIEESEKRAKLDTHISESISKLKFADSVKEKLKEKVSVLESTEEIDSVLESEVSYLEMVIQESTGVNLSSKGHVEKDIQESEDEKFINLLENM
jgi:hypothetical protein